MKWRIWRKAINLDSILKSIDITLLTKVHLVKALVFPVVMYGCKSCIVKKAEHRRIDAFELWCWKTLESPLKCEEIQPVHPKGNQSWIFTGWTDAEAETPLLWPFDVKDWLIWKDPDAGNEWRQEEKGMTENEMVGQHYQLNGHEFEKNSGIWWWTGKPGMLKSMEVKRIRHWLCNWNESIKNFGNVQFPYSLTL